MIITIILVVLFVLGLYLSRSYDFDTHMAGVLTSIITGVLLILHVAQISLASYEYHKLAIKRTSIVETLKESRTNSGVIERAAITKDVIKFNSYIAELKYKNTTSFFDPYIDDRIELMKPIK